MIHMQKEEIDIEFLNIDEEWDSEDFRRTPSMTPFNDKVIEYLVPESNNRELTREEALFENYNLYAKEKIDIKTLPRGAAWESPDVLDDAYADGRVARQAINRLRLLSENQTQPFFLAVGFVRPHLPFSAPKKYWDMHKPKKFTTEKITNLPIGSPKVAGKRGGEISNYKPVPTDRNAKISKSLQQT